MRAVVVACLMSVGVAGSCLAADDAVLSPAQVQAELKEQDYTGITDLTRQGDLYTADATRWGRSETGLAIEASTGNVMNAPKLTSAQVQALLGAKGYKDVADLTEHDKDFTATATHDGERIAWKIDATTGAIYPATD